MPRFLLAIALLIPMSASAEGHEAGATAAPPDWEAVADVDTVQVLTDNEDGTRRDTTVWLVVVDGQGYIRTGGTSWGENVQRNQDVELRIQDGSYALRVHFVEDDELRQQIVDAFREKYGFTDAAIGLFRGGSPLIMRLTSR